MSRWLLTAALAAASLVGTWRAALATPEAAPVIVWANDGGDKVTRDELRATTDTSTVRNSVWNGREIRLFAARNEIVSFNLVIEAASGARSVSVDTSDLVGPQGQKIRASAADQVDAFDWTRREIELFYVRYLRIRGLSRTAYGTYDERHVPERMRLPRGLFGFKGGWRDRPGHDKEFPEIAVPLELVRSFDVQPGTNQSIWADIYAPSDTAPGDYHGQVRISVADWGVVQIPVTLRVLGFQLADRARSRTMLATSYGEVARRYTGAASPETGSWQDDDTRLVMQRQAMLAHRHRIALVDDNGGAGSWPIDAPRPDWLPRLKGSLFTRAHGYAGPGEGVGSGVFSVGTYGQWKSLWGPPAQSAILSHAASWEDWFRRNGPDVERFLYLDDESKDYPKLEQWAGWLKEAGRSTPVLPSFATIDFLKAESATPSLDVVASLATIRPAGESQAIADHLHRRRTKLFMYNGIRPASGSFAIEDDGTALRELPWGQFKKGIDRWFYWAATYYDNDQGALGETDVLNVAQTFGGPTVYDESEGLVSSNSGNGDGVLFYPGTDRVFPGSSYGLLGPMASLRLKHWRRGIQDVEYLLLAAGKDADATQAIIERMVPKVLWEIGVASKRDPTWIRAPISWTARAEEWESARRDLADLIDGGQAALGR